MPEKSRSAGGAGAARTRRSACRAGGRTWRRSRPEAVRDGLGRWILGQQGGSHRVAQVAVERGLQGDVVVDELALHGRAEEAVHLREELILGIPAGSARPRPRVATCGTTLTLYPALSTVGLRVLRKVAPVSRDSDPILSMTCRYASGPYSMPSAAQASGEERLDRRGEPDRPVVAPDPGHGLGQLGDRVVGLQHRAVPGNIWRGC